MAHVLESVQLFMSIAVFILLDVSNYCQPLREITRRKYNIVTNDISTVQYSMRFYLANIIIISFNSSD